VKAIAKALVNALDKQNPGIRLAAVMALGELAAEPDTVVPALMRALRDGDVRVARQAAAALVKVGAPAVPALASALRDLSPLADPARIGKDGQTRALLSDYAAWALARIDAPVVPALAHIFNETVKRSNGQAPSSGSSRSAPTTKEPPFARAEELTLTPEYLLSEISFIIGKRGRRDLQDLARLSIDSSFRLRSLAMTLDRKLGSGAEAPDPEAVRLARVPSLIKTLEKDARGAFRAAAARSLGEFLSFHRSSSRKGPPIQGSQTASEPLREQAVLALAKSLSDSDLKVREEAGHALGLVGDVSLVGEKEIVPSMISALKVQEAHVQQAAARVLASIGSDARSAVPTLVGGLKYPPELGLAKDRYGSRSISESQFARALGRIGKGVPEAQACLMDILRDNNRRALHPAAMDGLAQLGSIDAIPWLIRSFKETINSDSPSSGNAANALLRIRPEGVNALITILKERFGAQNVRQRACDALASAPYTDKLISQALVESLKDSNDEIRKSSALGLARRGEELEKVMPVLADVLKRSRSGNWYGTLQTLVDHKEIGIPVLLDSLVQDRGGNERPAVLRSLIDLKRKDIRVAPAVELLQQLEQDDANFRAEVIVSLGKAGDSSPAVLQAILQALNDASPRVREAAATTLGTLRPDKPGKIVKALVAFLKDETAPGVNYSSTIRNATGSFSFRPVPAWAAFMSLRSYGPAAQDAVPDLVRLLAHKEPLVRQNAIEVLARIGTAAHEAEPQLRLALVDPENSVRIAASTALLEVLADPSAAGLIVQDLLIREYTNRLIDEFLNPLADELRPSGLQSGGAGSLPDFPWPPPRYTHIATAGADFPREIFGGDRTSLGAIHKKLFRGLKEVDQHFESSLFAAPGGFVMLVRLERINPDGTPLPGDLRWVYGTLPLQGVGDFVGRLFFEKPGYFRVVAFVITSEKNFGYGAKLLPELRSGGTELPDEVSQMPFKGKTCCALIYAFERKSGGGLTFFEKLSAQIHLEKSGILSALVRIE
jgi:HEAT repeat protein